MLDFLFFFFLFLITNTHTVRFPVMNLNRLLIICNCFLIAKLFVKLLRNEHAASSGMHISERLQVVEIDSINSKTSSRFQFLR